jgi:aspartyl aminopeptidase
MEFLDASPDPFHAVQTSADMLLQAGFTEIDPQDSAVHCRLLPGGKYFFTRNRSTLVAFAVGKKFQPGHGFKIIGAHTDSPNLKIKARSKRSPVGAANCIQLAVECYGGGLWHTWFDRDLSVAGRVFLLQQEQASSHATIQQRLIKIDRPILRIPNLAIHLQSTQEREAFSPNKEDHLLPILAMQVEKALAAPLTSNNATNSTTTTTNSEHLSDDKDGWTEHQEPILLHLLAKELHVKVSDIVDFELNLFDTQKASLGGAFSEFVHSARLDNLASCFMAVQSLIDYSDKQDDCNNLEQDEDISLIALFDHEEVGSSSATGAGSPIIKEAVELISSNLASTMNTNSPQPSSTSLYASAARKSFILSVDQAHALHPNYANKHEKGHAPRMNDGMVIKRNNNQRYATNALTALIIREIARRAQLPPVQEFVVRNDCPCGSTIGPILSSQTGIRAIDMGCPQLSMHSIRETMGTCDCTFYMD